MGGTGTATALDTFGGLFWNPATLSGLPSNEITFSGEVIMARTELSSRIGVPPFAIGGSTRGDNGSVLAPNVGITHHLEDSPISLSFGVISAGGFTANYPASVSNPALTPAPPVGVGLGRVYADLQVIQFVPALSVQVTDRFSVGVSPIVNMANLHANPLLFAAPDNANGDFFPSYRSGMHANWHWGAGFQIGAFYRGEDGWNFGVSYKSTQWFESFMFNTEDELGLPRRDRVRFDLPSIWSAGVAYTGFEDWLLALDVRYIDYANTAGFDGKGFAPNGAVRGLGWDSQIVVATGAQYRLTDTISIRGGYSYNNSPQESDVAFFNVASPTILEHVLYTGASWDVTHALTLSFAYAHGFENSVSGPIVLPTGAVPTSQVRSQVSADAFLMGVSVKY